MVTGTPELPPEPEPALGAPPPLVWVTTGVVRTPEPPPEPALDPECEPLEPVTTDLPLWPREPWLPLEPRLPVLLEPLLRVTTGLEALPLPEPEPVLTGIEAEPLLEVVTGPA